MVTEVYRSWWSFVDQAVKRRFSVDQLAAATASDGESINHGSLPIRLNLLASFLVEEDELKLYVHIGSTTNKPDKRFLYAFTLNGIIHAASLAAGVGCSLDSLIRTAHVYPLWVQGGQIKNKGRQEDKALKDWDTIKHMTWRITSESALRELWLADPPPVPIGERMWKPIDRFTFYDNKVIVMFIHLVGGHEGNEVKFLFTDDAVSVLGRIVRMRIHDFAITPLPALLDLACAPPAPSSWPVSSELDSAGSESERTWF